METRIIIVDQRNNARRYSTITIILEESGGVSVIREGEMRLCEWCGTWWEHDHACSGRRAEAWGAEKTQATVPV